MEHKNPAGDYEALPPVHEHAQEELDRERCKSRRRKFIVALLFSLWIGWNVIHDVVLLVRYMPTVSRLAIPPDVNIEYCAPWKEGESPGWGRRYETSSEFELPLSSDTLFLLARGLAAGNVNVKQGGEGDVAKVEVVAQYRDFEELREIQACSINRGDGRQGVGIFGPDWMPPRRREVSFAVTVYLPLASRGPVLKVKNFETDMPLFSHNIGDLAEGVHFDSVSFKTSNLPITVKSLNAFKAQSETENSAISGSFNVTSSLALITSNNPIDVTVNLNNDPNAEGATDVTMLTSNSPVRAKLNLLSAKETGGAFTIAASTSNSPIDISFLSAPVDSALALNAHTSAAPARVHLHETYQGKLQLRTSLSRPRVTWNEGVADPAGKGRRRNVNLRTVRSSLSGTVAWSEEGVDLGSVDVETSWSPVNLSL